MRKAFTFLPGNAFLMFAELGRRGYKLARRIVIGVIGTTVVLVGVIMLVTPGPALVVIPTGLAILALEFAWARHWLNRLKASLTAEQLNGFLEKTRNLTGNASKPRQGKGTEP
jgi:tellurite resistance protein TerC